MRYAPVVVMYLLTVPGLLAAQAQVEVVKQSDTVLILGLATTIATTISAIIGGVVAVLVARLNNKAAASALADEIVAQRAKEAANAAEEVRKTLQVNRVSTDKKLTDIKTLVNGGVEKSLRIAAIALRRVAATTNNKGDIEAAVAAEAALAEHVAAQAQVEIAHQDALETQSKSVGIGQAVGEMALDVKEVGKDVKELKDR